MIRRLLFAVAVAVAVAAAAVTTAAYGDEDDAVNGCHEGGYQYGEPNCGNDYDQQGGASDDDNRTSGCEWTTPPETYRDGLECVPDSDEPVISFHLTRF